MPVTEPFSDGDRYKTQAAGSASDDYIIGLYYTVHLAPGAGRNTGTLIAISGHPAITMSEGGSGACQWSFPRPIHWRKGNVKVTLLWSSDDASTANVVWRSRVGRYLLGDATSYDWAAYESTTIATAGTAKALQSTTINQSTTGIGLSDAEVICVDMERLDADASDTSITDAYVHGVTVEYQPSQSQ
jgi:hypothetical protein